MEEGAAAVKLTPEVITQPGGAHDYRNDPPNPLAASVELVLCIAFELGVSKWKMAFSIGLGQQPRHREVSARDLAAVRREIDRAKTRFGLPAEVRVASCYEAGRDGLWLHRALVAMGIENLVVDSASIEVSRRGRWAKTDRPDTGKLVGMLLRYQSATGRSGAWSASPRPRRRTAGTCTAS